MKNMAVVEAIRNRRSIRKFKPGAEVTDEQIKLLLEAAMLAPSACNTRPWEFVVVKDRAKLETIRKTHPYTGMLETASIAIIMLALPETQNDIRDGLPKGFYPQDCGAATRTYCLRQLNWVLGVAGAACIPRRSV